jgi:hypothetical protein
MKLEDLKYFFPKEEIERWQSGEELSEELKNHSFCFIKYDEKQKRIILSKLEDGSVDVEFAQELYSMFDDELKDLKPGVVLNNYKTGTKASAIKDENGKIMISFMCQFLTLDNLLYVLNQKKNE